MGIKGFEGTLSEESKKALKALQLETWKKVRDCMKENREVRHFTAENTAENAYGWTWDQVVKEYLRSGYDAEDKSPDIVVMGETYKTLRRPEVTVFYDAAGDTLFDVTNERLEKEYEWLMNSGTVDAAESMDAGEENGEDGKGNSVVEQTEEEPKVGETPPTERAEAEEEDITDNGADDVIPMGTASLKEIVTGVPAPTAEEIVVAEEENTKPVKQRAKEKLEKERESAKDSTFADPIIEYLLKRCNEDDGMAEDVVQEHKTWKKCFDYIYSRARSQAKGNCAAVRDDVVYEWAEDYYHKDDKAEEEKKATEGKAKKATTDSAKKTKSAAERKTARTKNTSDKAEKVPVPPKAEAPKEPSKPKRNGKEMDGQLDMFAMMGM
ncbi:MAG: hypothetical protein HFG42_14235 [Lachnospiraceae bacterium]|nr:hypothetical protein [Lachnospiraceae bacterium]